MAGNFGARCFVFANFRYESSVSLEFAVEVEVDVAFFQDFNSMAYVVDGFASARTFGGVGKESNFRIEDLNGTTSTFYADASDISELFRRRLGITPQSPSTRIPLSPYCGVLVKRMKAEDTVLLPGRGPMT